MASLRGVSPPFEFTNILFVTLIFLSLFCVASPANAIIYFLDTDDRIRKSGVYHR